MSASESKRERLHAFWQLVVLAGIAGLLVVAAWWKSQRPADATRLRLPIADLHSQAAELEALSREGAAHRVTARFVRGQAMQLRVAQRRSERELANLHPWPEFAAGQRDALADAHELRAHLEFVAAPGGVDEGRVQVLRARLGQRERALRD